MISWNDFYFDRFCAELEKKIKSVLVTSLAEIVQQVCVIKLDDILSVQKLEKACFTNQNFD